MTSAKRAKTKKSEERSSKKKSLSSTANKQSKAAQKVVKSTPKKVTVEKAAAKKTSKASQSKPVDKKTASVSKKKAASNKKAPVDKSAISTKSPKTTKTTAKKSSSNNTPPQTAAKKKPANVSKVHAKKSIAKKSPSRSKKTTSKTLIEFPTTNWGTDSVISFEATDHLPPAHLTSISGGFVFHDGNVVLANIPGRGWEVIGGRIDIGETPEETFRRETSKQIGVSLAHVEQIGIIRIEHLGPEPPNCPYPFPVGYGVQYIGIVGELTPFNGSDESLGRSLISYEGFKEHYYDWNEYYEAVFNYAYSVYKKLRKKLKI